jgi:hypothetical protein
VTKAIQMSIIQLEKTAKILQWRNSQTLSTLYEAHRKILKNLMQIPELEKVHVMKIWIDI